MAGLWRWKSWERWADIICVYTIVFVMWDKPCWERFQDFTILFQCPQKQVLSGIGKLSSLKPRELPKTIGLYLCPHSEVLLLVYISMTVCEFYYRIAPKSSFTENLGIWTFLVSFPTFVRIWTFELFWSVFLPLWESGHLEFSSQFFYLCENLDIWTFLVSFPTFVRIWAFELF